MMYRNGCCPGAVGTGAITSSVHRSGGSALTYDDPFDDGIAIDHDTGIDYDTGPESLITDPGTDGLTRKQARRRARRQRTRRRGDGEGRQRTRRRNTRRAGSRERAKKLREKSGTLRARIRALREDGVTDREREQIKRIKARRKKLRQRIRGGGGQGVEGLGAAQGLGFLSFIGDAVKAVTGIASSVSGGDGSPEAAIEAGMNLRDQELLDARREMRIEMLDRKIEAGDERQARTLAQRRELHEQNIETREELLALKIAAGDTRLDRKLASRQTSVAIRTVALVGTGLIVAYAIKGKRRR